MKEARLKKSQYGSIYMKCSEQTNTEAESKLVITRGLGEGEQGVIANGYRVSF